MVDYYYSPFQYELREGLEFKEGVPGPFLKAASLAGRAGVPAPITATALGAIAFLAYTPLLQPGPPARLQDPYTLPMINLGGGMIV
ncbi:MAG: hypothetical protein K0U52_05360 [Gammaproteobacteria bacterium]|nr:hypothetical protein [Gammaproteobacteria bacterium]